MSHRRQSILLIASLFAVTLLAYLPAIRGDFIWDDDRHVSENRTLLNLQGLERIWFHPRYLPQWYPMTHTSFWLEYRLWGKNPLGYHIDNVLLHAINAVLLYLLLRRLNVSGAMLAATVFALHPIEVETVAWISERKNLLSTFFALLAILAYLRLTDSSCKAFRWYFLPLLLFIAALLSKTVACSTPAVILVLLWWKRGRIRARDIGMLAPFFAIGLGLAAFTAHTETAYVGAHGPDWDLTVMQRCLIAARAVWFYAAKLLWPMELTFSYPRWQINPHDAPLYLFPLAAIAVAVGLWLLRRRIGRGPVAAIVIFAGVLVPALGFLNTYPMRYSFVADHFQYAAGVALIALVAATACRIVREKVAVAILGTVLATLTWRQAHAYAGPEALWNDVIAKNDSSWMARQNLGVVFTQKSDGEPPEQARGDLEQAVRLFGEVQQLRPQHEKLQMNWAEALFRLGHWEECLPHYAAAMNTAGAIKPAVLDRMGQALAHLHRLGEAEADFRAALAGGAGVDSHVHLADVLAAQGRDQVALDEYAGVLKAVPNEPGVHLAMATILARSHRLAEAAAHLKQYLQAVPSDAAVHERLGRLYLELHQPADAARQFSAALALVPNFDAAQQGLADALGQLQAGPSGPGTQPGN